MLRDYYHTRLGRCSLPQVCLRLMHFVVDVLRLLPPTGNNGNGGAKAAAAGAESQQDRPGATPIQVLARQPSWLLLNDDQCVQVSGCCLLSEHVYSYNSRASADVYGISVCRSCSTWLC